MSECEVWWATPAMRAPWTRELLSAAERDRVLGLRRDADQARSEVGAALLRLVAGARLGIDPATVGVERSCPDCDRPHGRPSLPGTGLHASISHSGDRVAVALTPAGPVGVDVEKLGTADPAELGRLVLAPGEKASGPAEFLVYWTRKESVVKATGEGLRAPLTEVAVTGPGEPPRLTGYRGGGPPPAVLADLSPGEGYVAALTVLTTGPLRVREQDAAPLLGRRP